MLHAILAALLLGTVPLADAAGQQRPLTTVRGTGDADADALPADHPEHAAQGRRQPARRAAAAAHAGAGAAEGPTVAGVEPGSAKAAA